MAGKTAGWAAADRNRDERIKADLSASKQLMRALFRLLRGADERLYHWPRVLELGAAGEPVWSHSGLAAPFRTEDRNPWLDGSWALRSSRRCRERRLCCTHPGPWSTPPGNLRFTGKPLLKLASKKRLGSCKMFYWQIKLRLNHWYFHVMCLKYSQFTGWAWIFDVVWWTAEMCYLIFNP